MISAIRPAKNDDFAYWLQIAALMTNTITPAKNDHLEASDRILQNSHLLGSNGVKDFTVGGPKYRFHNKHPKAS